MTARERGFLLLASHLGDPERQPLTAAQLRLLSRRAEAMEIPAEDRDLTEGDLVALGYDFLTAAHILELLGEEEKLDRYLKRGERQGCVPVTRLHGKYPPALRKGLGGEAPGCLWAKGDLSILDRPMVSLVGSRDLGLENGRFAAQVGRKAAGAGFTLVSGNARGADRMAQEACLEAGGCVLSIVADELGKQRQREKLLYVSEEDFSEGFSTLRALRRNRSIHALGRAVFVAQSALGKGGTWDGTVKNLRHGWSPVLCFRDGSESSLALEEMGAGLIGMEGLDTVFSML